MTATWLLSMMAIAAAGLGSRSIGKPAWWIGTPMGPSSALLLVLPLIAPVTAIVAVRRWPARSPWVGVVCALVTGGVALGDVAYSPGTAVVVGAVAAAALLASIASLAGRRNGATAR
jgi:hypothetical protein